MPGGIPQGIPKAIPGATSGGNPGGTLGEIPGYHPEGGQSRQDTVSISILHKCRTTTIQNLCSFLLPGWHEVCSPEKTMHRDGRTWWSVIWRAICMTEESASRKPSSVAYNC